LLGGGEEGKGQEAKTTATHHHYLKSCKDSCRLLSATTPSVHAA
jgi:hypothetical protein